MVRWWGRGLVQAKVQRQECAGVFRRRLVQPGSEKGPEGVSGSSWIVKWFLDSFFPLPLCHLETWSGLGFGQNSTMCRYWGVAVGFWSRWSSLVSCSTCYRRFSILGCTHKMLIMWWSKSPSTWGNWCFWTVVLEKTLESPLDCKEIKPVNPNRSQSWIFIVEGLMLKLKLPYFGQLMWRTNSCWERLKAGGEGDDRGWDGWMASSTRWAWVSANSGRYWRTGKPEVLQFMGSQIVEHNWTTEQQQQP